jgi:flavin-dependent dehydrogenase
MYDVVVAGGSIAGLLCAREIAENKNTVLVIEEDYEIGTPEHCGGLVSIKGLEKLGIIPFRKTFDHLIESAIIYAPNGNNFSINSKKQQVAEISRRELDKQIAHQAQKNGAEIRVRTSFQELTENGIRTNKEEIECKIFVDARGISSLIQKDRTGIVPSAQYEIYADWIKKGRVEVFFDQEKYPGFFAWVIPSGEGRGKVGVAGKGVQVSETLEELLEKKGKHSTIRKIFAPVWVKGPIKKFVEGVFAGRAISKFLKSNNESDLEEYQKKWNNQFGEEFEKQLLARKILERIDNNTINKLFDSITPEITKEISENEDFDFHTGSIVKLLGLKGSLKTAQIIIGGELKKLLK